MTTASVALSAAPALRARPGLLRTVSGWHAQLYVATQGRVGRRWPGGATVVVLVTVGRRTGLLRSTPLVCLHDGTDLVVVASNGGARRVPDWYLNLHAQGRAVVHDGGRTVDVEPRDATGDERARLWHRLAHLAPVDRYEGWAGRCLPVVVLHPHPSSPSSSPTSTSPPGES